MKESTTPLHQIKLRCQDCNHGMGKQLEFNDGTITQALIDLFIFKGLTHERIHPSHEAEVIIYQNAPETIDIEE